MGPFREPDYGLTPARFSPRAHRDQMDMAVVNLREGGRAENQHVLDLFEQLMPLFPGSFAGDGAAGGNARLCSACSAAARRGTCHIQ